MYGLSLENFQGATFLAVAIIAASCACVYLVWFVIALWGHEQGERGGHAGQRAIRMEDVVAGADWYDEVSE